MANSLDGSHAYFRNAVYWLLMVTSTGAIAGRILQIKSEKGDTPFLSANDRSRWCAIRALVDYGEFSIDRVILRDASAPCSRRYDPAWNTIDKVRHIGPDGAEHYYSSKPPLFPTLLAGKYWLLKHGLGAHMEENSFYIARVILITTNLIPWIVYLFLLTRIIERYGVTDWGRIFVMGTAAWGTFLSTFAVTLNNHLPAAISVLAALYAALPIWRGEHCRWTRYAASGLFAAFAAANELPSLSFLALLGGVLLWKSPVKTLLGYLPAAILVGIVFFGVNYAAHQSFRPPYAHRGEGDNWYDYKCSYWMTEKKGVDQGEPSRRNYAFHLVLGHHGILSLSPVWLLSVLGGGLLMTPRLKLPRELREYAWFAIALTFICLAFYIMRPQQDRNYGGVACGLRWMFWFIPLWSILLIPAADAMAHRKVTQILALVLLLISVASAHYATLNPWSHPWLYDYWEYLGWLPS